MDNLILGVFFLLIFSYQRDIEEDGCKDGINVV